MKHAKIKNGKIKDVIIGLAPSNEPIVSVVDGEAHEHWGFILKPIEAIKLDIYKKQKTSRDKSEDAPIEFKGKSVKIKGDKNKLRIQNLNGFDVGFKISDNEWLDLNPAEIKDLQKALYDSTQNAFRAEREANELVSAMNTHEELKNYMLTL